MLVTGIVAGGQLPSVGKQLAPSRSQFLFAFSSSTETRSCRRQCLMLAIILLSIGSNGRNDDFCRRSSSICFSGRYEVSTKLRKLFVLAFIRYSALKTVSIRRRSKIAQMLRSLFAVWYRRALYSL